MGEDFRGLLGRLERAGLLRRVKREVDPRHFSTLLEQASSACQLRFNKVFLRSLIERLQGIANTAT